MSLSLALMSPGTERVTNTHTHAVGAFDTRSFRFAKGTTKPWHNITNGKLTVLACMQMLSTRWRNLRPESGGLGGKLWGRAGRH